MGGALLLLASAVAIVWANSPWRHEYFHLAHVHLGPASLGLNLSVAHWTADGLLAAFFFVVGLELKHEFVHGELRDPAKAALPIAAALCGVALPAGVYALVATIGNGSLRGWAIPTATDIAFALAVLAVLGSHLPAALRSFLLTLAVVDDLIAITIIAFFYSDHIRLVPLGLGVVAIAVFAAGCRIRVVPMWVLVLPALVAWALVYRSGVHATIAGVLLGLAVPARLRAGDREAMTHRLEVRIRPLVAGLCVPLFAFFAAGVTVVGGGLGAAVRDPITLGIVVGLVLGKPVGVLAGTWLTARFTRARLDDGLTWSDVVGVSLLSGIGFTVSLLIGDLAFGVGSSADDHVKLAVLAGSLISAGLAAVVLRRRNAAYRALEPRTTTASTGTGLRPAAAQTPSGRSGSLVGIGLAGPATLLLDPALQHGQVLGVVVRGQARPGGASPPVEHPTVAPERGGAARATGHEPRDRADPAEQDGDQDPRPLGQIAHATLVAGDRVDDPEQPHAEEHQTEHTVEQDHHDLPGSPSG